MARLLKARGMTVKRADSVATGRRALDAESFDVILSDLGLPDGSGHDLLRQARAAGVATPAVVLSGFGSDRDREQSAPAGFAEHLTKPIDFDALVDAVRRNRGGRRPRRLDSRLNLAYAGRPRKASGSHCRVVRSPAPITHSATPACGRVSATVTACRPAGNSTCAHWFTGMRWKLGAIRPASQAMTRSSFSQTRCGWGLLNISRISRSAAKSSANSISSVGPANFAAASVAKVPGSVIAIRVGGQRRPGRGHQRVAGQAEVLAVARPRPPVVERAADRHRQDGRVGRVRLPRVRPPAAQRVAQPQHLVRDLVERPRPRRPRGRPDGRLTTSCRPIGLSQSWPMPPGSRMPMSAPAVAPVQSVS